MSVEALWVVRYGDASMPSIIDGYSNAGVVVLETGRVFGGDAGYYYLGNSEVQDNQIAGRVRITHFNGPLVDAFRTGRRSFEVEFMGVVQGGLIDGHMHPVDPPGPRLPVRLEFKARLP
jgi:hypothetical protein